MNPKWFLPCALAAALASACSPSPTAAAPTITVVQRPATWAVVESSPQGEWTRPEAAFINDALYLLDESLPPEDARHALLRQTPILPRRLAPADRLPFPDGLTGVFSPSTGCIYLADLDRVDLSVLTATLAHELHHRERDSVATDVLSAHIECERAAHAREAADMERAAELLRTRSLGPAGLPRRFDGAVLKARASAAAYTLKAELVRVLETADTLDGDPPDRLAQVLRRCTELAQRPIERGVADERGLLEALDTAVFGTPLDATFHKPMLRARVALERFAASEAAVAAFQANAPL